MAARDSLILLKVPLNPINQSINQSIEGITRNYDFISSFVDNYKGDK